LLAFFPVRSHTRDAAFSTTAVYFKCTVKKYISKYPAP
jgi:hypothetical protein